MNENSNNKIIAVVGATASGKTDYSIELAKNINGEIISADSRLVYKDFNIGTAKPTMEERQGIPHYMIDIVSPTADYSVGLYVKDAKKCISDILNRGKTPIIVGGTGLYMNALLMNYDFPECKPDYEYRNSLRSRDDLYDMLFSLDEAAANTIDKNDKKKIIRALEIIKTTGKKLSEQRCVKGSEFDVEWIGLNFERDVLYDRINKRVDFMLENGLVDETKLLLSKYGRIDNVLYTIGYQEMTSYLDGLLTLKEAVDRLKQNTRRYAKRQLTWFRKNKDIKWNVYPETLKK